MARPKKTENFITTEEWKDYIQKNMTFEQIINELAAFKLAEKKQPINITVPATARKLAITQEEFDYFFRIKNANGRGRKKKVTDEDAEVDSIINGADVAAALDAAGVATATEEDLNEKYSEKEVKAKK